MTDIEEFRFRIPERHLAAEAFFGGTAEAFQQWVEALPMMNVGTTARDVVERLGELNRLRAPVEHRYQLLEIIRPVVHFLCNALSRTYLNDSLVLEEQERRVASLAQSLQHDLATGYKIVISEVLEAGIRIDMTAAERGIGRCFASSLHRALADASRTLLRSAQLYTPAPGELWLDLHRLYRIADLSSLLGFTLDDDQNRLRPRTSIGDAYRRAVLLACARPNKLRQESIAILFQALEDWSRFVSIGATDTAKQPLYLVALDIDRAPLQTRLRDEVDSSELRGVDTSVLVHLLNEYLSDALEPGSEAAPGMPEGITDDLVRHVVQAWGVLTKRAFSRFEAAGTLEVCSGFDALHYYSSGGAVLQPESEPDPAAEVEVDPWADDDYTEDTLIPRGARRPPGSAPQPQASTTTAFPVVRARLADTSPGGYGVVWEGTVPETVRTGELLGVREADDHHWSIAVIRWLQQDDAAARMGLELLAPRAFPVEVRILQTLTTRESWKPALKLPELPVINQPSMLIVSDRSLKLGQKISIREGSGETRAQLSVLGDHSEGFAEFEFRVLEHASTQQDTGIEVGFVSEEEFWARIDADMDAKPAKG